MGMGDMGTGDFGGDTGGGEDAVSRLRRLISDREQESLQILEDWMDDTSAREQA